MRQAIFIAIGLALGIGLVITVSAASNGVQNSQATVLHSLYGVGTDVTVTQPPPKGSGNSTTFGFQQQVKNLRKGARSGQIAAGSSIDINDLVDSQYGTISTSSLAEAGRQDHVTSAVGGLVLNDIVVTGTVPALNANSGSVSSNFSTNTFTVDGVDVGHLATGPLSAAKLTAGRQLSAADPNARDAVADSNYASQNKKSVGQTVSVGGKSFKIIGIVSVPQGSSPPDLYVPLAQAQAIGKSGTNALTGKVNTIYVTADSASNIGAVQREIAKILPSATITDSSDLASEVSGSLSSASSLANNLGKWLSVAVLIAAFGLASLLTMAAVARRVREFGTLKALGWSGWRITGQVMGESIVIGVIGGAAGIGLGFAGAAVIGALAPKLTATVGSSAAQSTTGGAGVLGSQGASSALNSLSDSAHTVSVTLTAPVTVTVVLVAVILAIAGGLIAGSFGGWRAARLSPAVALARVE